MSLHPAERCDLPPVAPLIFTLKPLSGLRAPYRVRRSGEARSRPRASDGVLSNAPGVECRLVLEHPTIRPVRAALPQLRPALDFDTLWNKCGVRSLRNHEENT
jgi:hypothetical protein